MARECVKAFECFGQHSRHHKPLHTEDRGRFADERRGGAHGRTGKRIEEGFLDLISYLLSGSMIGWEDVKTNKSTECSSWKYLDLSAYCPEVNELSLFVYQFQNVKIGHSILEEMIVSQSVWNVQLPAEYWQGFFSSFFGFYRFWRLWGRIMIPWRWSCRRAWISMNDTRRNLIRLFSRKWWCHPLHCSSFCVLSVVMLRFLYVNVWFSSSCSQVRSVICDARQSLNLASVDQTRLLKDARDA